MDDKLCLLVIIGTTEDGTKELVAVEDGFRESSESWYELLSDLRSRGLKEGPMLAIGDGALGFWNAVFKVYPETKHQRCWVHKTLNVLDCMPKSLQPKAKEALHNIWMAKDERRGLKSLRWFPRAGSAINILKPPHAWKKTGKSFWPFMTSLQRTGFT